MTATMTVVDPGRGLRPADNPFAAHRLDALRFRPQGVSWSDLLARLEALSFRAAIVGPEGAGKTALLEKLADRLGIPARTVRLGPVSRAAVTTAALAAAGLAVAHGEVLLVDSGELLGPVAWRRLLHRARHAPGLVATMHRPGRLPTLVTCRTSPQLLQELVCELAPDLVDHLAPLLPALHERHRGNLRECLLELYDTAAQT